MPFITPPKPWPIPKPCPSPEHNPPGHLYLPPGVHVWKCPCCGREVTIHKPGVTL